jgi:hypothetical protein
VVVYAVVEGGYVFFVFGYLVEAFGGYGESAVDFSVFFGVVEVELFLLSKLALYKIGNDAQ